MIERAPSQRDIRRAYDVWSHCYDIVAAPWEAGARRQALPFIRGRRILDVGIGSGAFFTDILRAAGRNAVVCGAELSRAMVKRARRRLSRLGLPEGLVVEASALQLPFPANSFDTVMSSYVLDLLAVPHIEGALRQFHRVLRPGGRVVLVNLTSLDSQRTTWYERCYGALPGVAQAYVLGGCRPVQLAPLMAAAGFDVTGRTVIRQFLSSEIVVGERSEVRSEAPHAA